MIRTRITEMLGIAHLVRQGGMMWVDRGELAAAVSNAGRLGLSTVLTQSEGINEAGGEHLPASVDLAIADAGDGADSRYAITVDRYVAMKGGCTGPH